MPAFDTTVLVALFDTSHEHHAKAKKAFREADAVLLHPCVVQEFTTVVRRLAKDSDQDGNRAARTALGSLLKQPRVTMVRSMAYEPVVQLYMATPTLSFTDAVVSEMRWQHDMVKPVTFDKTIESSWKGRARHESH